MNTTSASDGEPSKSEVLYNGIKIQGQWPPRNYEASSKEPNPVPYLEVPPEVIPIDVGRQLFVDDFLIWRSSCANLQE